MRKRAIIITYPQEHAKREAIALAEAAGYEILDIVTQQYLTRSKYGMGRGKAYDVKELVKQLKPDVIIFDEMIGASQAYNLASLFQVEIIDRERLILDIFEKRANSAESSIQVKLAQLRYEVARVREKVRLAKLGEQPGFYGLGRYEVDDYYRDIKRRISLLKKKLEKVSKRRELYRYYRERQGLPIISLAGYTSAGKTTLFNLLVKEKHDVSDEMFTTLTTYTRALDLNDKVLLSDTVGFISKLPAYMIEAFKSTLDELMYADLVLLVIDISDPIDELMKKYHSCIDILNELQVNYGKIIFVLNKIDLIDNEDLISRVKALKIDNYIAISAKKRINIDRLLDKIEEMLKPKKVIHNTKKHLDVVLLDTIEHDNT